MSADKTSNSAKKSLEKPASLSVHVSTEPKQVPVDWNVWHKPMMDCIAAFHMDETLYLVDQHKIRFNGLDPDPLSARTLYTKLAEICGKLVELHVNNWEYRVGKSCSPMDGVNIYRDDSGTLVAELDFACDELPDIYLDPKLVVMLYIAQEGPWFQITFNMASQTF